MIEIRQTIEEIKTVENQSKELIENARAEANAMIQQADRDNSTYEKKRKEELKEKVDELFARADVTNLVGMNDAIRQANDRAVIFKAKVEKRVDETSDYVVRKVLTVLGSVPEDWNV